MDSRPDLTPLMSSNAAAETRQSWPLRNFTKDATAKSANKRGNLISRLKGHSRLDDGGVREGWKPLSMTTPILVAIAAMSIVIAVSIELLAQASKAQGGLALSPSQDDIPQYAMISYLYGPNVIAVLYSLIWSWVDLDAKRMQPWFELSKRSGATAANSIFLDYPYDFVAAVPFKAAKRKHWPVFLTGTTMVIIFWVITPLQSAILGTGVVSLNATVNIATRSQLIPMEQQMALLNPEVLGTGYSIGWLNQPFPPFMTADYATLPFHLDHDPAPTEIGTNWTATTTKLSTELDCWPAEVSPNRNQGSLAYDFLNGQGCNFTMQIPWSSNYTMQYIGYASSPYSDYALVGSTCPPTSNSTHQSLAIWTKTTSPQGQMDSPTFEITALYCQPQYYKQEILVTVAAAGSRPITKFERVLSPRELLSAEEFNSTAFEFLLTNGMDEKPVTRDVPFNTVIEPQPRLAGNGLMRPVSNMVGFALAGQNRSTEEYGDPKVLQQAFEHAQQYLFSVAVSALLQNETSFSNHTATSSYSLSGILVSRPFSATVEALLLLVAVFTFVLLWVCRTTPCHLYTNPSSISKLVDIFRNSPEIVGDFTPFDNSTDKTLQETFRDDIFRLCYKDMDGDVQLALERIGTEQVNTGGQESNFERGFYEPVRPFPLRRGVGIGFIAILLGGMATLAYFKREAEILNGLPRPSQSFEVLQILENYVPTIFATMVEPFLVLLNRLLCVLQPFKELWVGKAKLAKSIEADYTSIPPQLVFGRAFKSEHFILAVMCSIALLSNVLAVGLGALFNEAPMVEGYPQSFSPSFEVKFNDTAVSDFQSYLMNSITKSTQNPDHLYIAMSNISSGNPLPPWVSKDYFFQPLNFVGDTERNGQNTYQVTTRGLGINANCTPIPKFDIPRRMYLAPAWNQKPYQNITVCPDFVDLASRRVRNSVVNRPTGLSAFEYCGTWSSGLINKCDKPLTLGWGRTPEAENMNGTIDSFFTVCHPIFETAMFNVTIDSLGNVISYNRTSTIESTLNYTGSDHHIDWTIINFNRQVAVTDAYWHNDTLARNWMNYLAILSTGSRSNIDPNTPTPGANETIPVIEDLYRRTFAIFLSLNTHLFEPSDSSVSINGIRLAQETRIFLDPTAFIVTMTILCLDVVVAAIFYMRTVVFVLPRMPTTIGSILAFVAPSRVVSDNYHKFLGEKTTHTFSFGRYVGHDDKVHLGIEMDPHVVPVDPESFRGKKRWMDGMSFMRLRNKTVDEKPETWI